MENWADIVEEVFGRGTRIVFPRFFESKKNQVTLLNLERGGEPFCVVAKYFVWGDPDRELETLGRAHSLGLRVPGVVGRWRNIGFLEFIPGKTLKVIAENDPDCLDPVPVGSWLGKFHEAFFRDGTKFLKGDSMLPNFIIHSSSGELFGVDFEESREGEAVEEVSDLAATMLLAGTPRSPVCYTRAAEFIRAYCHERNITLDSGVFMESLTECILARIRYMPHRKDEFLGYVSGIRAESEILIASLTVDSAGATRRTVS